MSDAAIDAMNRRISELTEQVAQARNEAKTRRKANVALKTELDAVNAKAVALTAERDDFKVKATATPTELQGKIAELTAQIAQRDHRDAFSALYDDADLGLNKSVPVDTLWKLIDYKPDGPPDPAKIKAAVTEAQTRHSFLKGQTGGETPPPDARASTGPKPTLEGALGASRGGRDTASTRFVLRRTDREDPEYMRSNQKAIAEASRAGSLVYQD